MLLIQEMYQMEDMILQMCKIKIKVGQSIPKYLTVQKIYLQLIKILNN